MKPFWIILLLALSFPAQAADLSYFELRTMPNHEIPAYWVNYARALAPLNEDRLNTLSLKERGFKEINPLLGRQPSDLRINAWFALHALLISPVVLEQLNIPDWMILSIIDTSHFHSVWITDLNQRAFSQEIHFKHLPVGFVISANF